MVPSLLSVPSVEYILSERLCQDPLESFFGKKQRAARGRSDNPTVLGVQSTEFAYSTVSFLCLYDNLSILYTCIYQLLPMLIHMVFKCSIQIKEKRERNNQFS